MDATERPFKQRIYFYKLLITDDKYALGKALSNYVWYNKQKTYKKIYISI